MEERFFPREVTGHIPRITMVGNEVLHVEQHNGLAIYQPDTILFRSSIGQIRVTGEKLRFQTYSSQEASVTGVIDSVVMEYGAKGGAAR